MERVIVPRLRQADWNGKDQVVSRSLIPDRTDSPVVAFGYDLPHTIQYINRSDLAKLNMSEAEIEQEAIRNLRDHPASWKWEKLEADFLSESLDLLSCDGDFLAAEHILNPGFMMEAQRLLECQILAVCIPRAGMLLVTHYHGFDAERIVDIALLADTLYQAAEMPITPNVFAMKDGKILSVLAGVKANEQSVSHQAPPSDASRITRFVATAKDTGLESVIIMASGSDLNTLMGSVWTAIVESFNEFMPRAKFSGHVEVKIMPGQVRDGEALKQAVNNLEYRFAQFVSDLPLIVARGSITRSGQPLKLTISPDDSAS
jgi:uncharacterized protein YtpQ (UPF0354 family)